MRSIRGGLVSVVLIGVAFVMPNARGVGATTTTSPPAISTAGFQSLVLRADGSVFSFGSNTSGQLGRSSPNLATNSVPAAVPGMTDIAQIAAGGNHSLVLREDATAWAFGSNTYGELGVSTNAGTDASNSTAVPVAMMPGVTRVFAGVGRSFVVRSDGPTFGFGENFSGSLGIPANIDNFLPNSVPTQLSVSNVVAMAFGNFHTLAVRSDGSVWAFGDNVAGQLGSVTNNGVRSANATPTQVAGLTSIIDVAAGNDFSLALRSDGTVWGFGSNVNGQLGSTVNVGTTNANPTPLQVPGLSGVTAIAAGSNFGLALRGDGSVGSFGANGFGQLARTTPDLISPNPEPSPIPALTNVAAIAAGNAHGMALRTDGVVLSFGDNGEGQLGHKNSLLAPVRLPARFVSITPTRILDTRPGSAVNFSGPQPGPGTSSQLKVPVVGRAGVPSSATAIASNLTVTESTNGGFVQITADLPSNTSNVNPDPAQTISNSVIVPLAIDGSVLIFTSIAAHLLLDITGYFVPTAAAVTAGRLVAVAPTRVFDTRPASAVNYVGGAPARGSVTRVRLAGRGPIPPVGAAAVVLAITATDTAAPGFIQVAPAGLLVPGASSTLNAERPDQTLSKQVIVPLGTDGSVDVYSEGGANLIVDVAGYITDDTAVSGTDGLFIPISPTRGFDTRPASATGYVGPKPSAGAVVTVDTQNRGGTPISGVAAVAANVTITEATAPGFVQAAASGSLVPGASSILNATRANQTLPNAAIVPVRLGAFDLYTQSGGHLLVDLFGYFTDS